MTCEGQVWRWFSDDAAFTWDELWLLLDNPYLNRDAWDAINLESGLITTVWPTGPGSLGWERFT